MIERKIVFELKDMVGFFGVWLENDWSNEKDINKRKIKKVSYVYWVLEC